MVQLLEHSFIDYQINWKMWNVVPMIQICTINILNLTFSEAIWWQVAEPAKSPKSLQRIIFKIVRCILIGDWAGSATCHQMASEKVIV